jgi:hypothetical protein
VRQNERGRRVHVAVTFYPKEQWIQQIAQNATMVG